MAKPRLELPEELFDLLDVSWAPAAGGLNGFLSAFLSKCCLWFEASGSSIFLREGESRRFALVSKAGSDSTVPLDAAFEEGVGIAGLCAQTGEAFLVGDPSEHPLLAAVATPRRLSIGTALVLPLFDSHHVCAGVLNLSRDASMEPFQTADLSHAQRLASVMALAVNNARLIDEVNQANVETARLKRLAEVGQLTAAIAHEIRNPLTGILGAAQMIQEDPGRAEMFGKVIEDETRKLNGLCDEFLEFARPLVIRPARLTLSEVAKRVIATLEQQFERAGVELCIEHLGEPSVLFGDSDRLEQVIRNLLLNALQACERGCHVTVKIEKASLSVEDNGQGISQDAVTRLFTPFFTTKPHGTGLGLSMVRKIVEAHGGSVSMQSDLGKGARFEIRLETAEHKKERLIA